MMKKSNPRLFLDIHAIQTVPPANINRDDTGSPKTAQYGGVIRARVSSQSWKRAMRKYFYSNADIKNVGVRSVDIVRYIGQKIIEKEPSLSLETAMNMAENTLNLAKISTKNKKTKALFFISDSEASKFAQACLDRISDKSDLQAILKADPSIDIALFGRMVADDNSLNADASSQVAHAISTHAIEREFDFFTATDDLVSENNSGTKFLQTTEYNSSTLYRYANIALHDFYRQLADKTEFVEAVKLFLEAFVKSMPTGKINTFANQTLPHAVVVTLREDRPLSMVSVFEEPIEPENGYSEKSIKKLFEEYDKFDKILEKPVFTEYLLLDDNLAVKKIGKEAQNLPELLSDLAEKINDNFED